MTGRARLYAWSVGPGRWPIAATSLLVGLVVANLFARVQVESGTTDPMTRLVVGECFNDSDTVVACRHPHDDEVYYRFTLPRGPFLGDDHVNDAATAICDGHLNAYVGSQHADFYFDWPITPDQFEWAAGDHVAICGLSRMDEKTITDSAHQTH
jgi:hypothetical protein